MGRSESPSRGVSTSEEEALRKASRAAARAGMLPGTFRACVRGRDVDREGYRRVAHRIERRTVALPMTPAPGAKKRDEQALPDPRAVDPWGVDPQRLPGASKVVARCPSCRGDKKVACPACAGDGRVACQPCGGGGKVRGERGLKSCPSCRGRGTTKCSYCRQGRIACPTCDAVGRVHAWLEVRSEQLLQVRAHPMTGVAALHEGLLAADDLDRDPRRYRLPLTRDSGWIATLPSALGPELAPQLAPVTDRVLAHRIQRFDSQVFRFAYATRVGDGVVKVTGSPPGILPESTWRPLQIRLGVAVGVGFVVLLIAAQVHAAYRAQAPWFEAHGSGGELATLGFVAAIAAGLATAGLLLPTAARTLLRAGVPLLVAATTSILMAVLFFVGGPTVEGVEAAMDRGDLAAAHLEIDAVETLHARTDGAQAARERLAAMDAEEVKRAQLAEDREHLDRLRQTTSAPAVVAALREPWNTPERAEEARQVALATTSAQVDARFQARDEDGLLEIAAAVETLDPKLTARARSRATLSRAARCIKGDEAECAVAALREVDPAIDDDAEGSRVRDALKGQLRDQLRARIATVEVASDALDGQELAIRRALDDVRLLGTIAPDEAPPKSPEALHQLLTKTQAAKRRRADAEARAERRAAAKAAQAQAQAERAAARRTQTSDRVQCCDGTYSPTCTYSRASLRGCCSHHGGVC